MSEPSPSQTASTSSAFKPMLDAALTEYKKKTGHDLLAHPLATELQTCTSVGAVLDILRFQASHFEQSGDQKLMRSIDPLVHVLYTFSNALGDGVNLPLPPAKVISTGIGVLLAAAKDARASHGAITDLFERIESFFDPLENYTRISLTTKLAEVLVNIVIELLSILSIATKEVKRRRAKKASRKLLGRTDIEDVLKRLGGLIQEVQMAVAPILKVATEVKDGAYNDNMSMDPMRNDMEEVEHDKVKVKRDVEEVKWEEIEQDIREWFSPPDLSTNYNIACETRYKETITWFFQGTKFKNWMSSGSLLWIHGKPGSGKTILCSAIIKRMISLRDAGQASLAFFYFDFRDKEQKQDYRNFTSSLLVQLSAHSSPCCKMMSHIYSTHGKGRQQPSIDVLKTCLREMLNIAAQQPMYVIVDALDECPNSPGMPTPREDVLNLLEGLVHMGLPKLHICVTGRTEADIKDVLGPLASTVSLHDEIGQKKDIFDYVSYFVSSNRRMRRWQSDQKGLVVEELSKKANGIFRWVFCQLEVLQHFPAATIQQAIDQLPESLDETYVRVLSQIPRVDQAHAHRILECLMMAVRPLPLEELAEWLADEFEASPGGIPEYRATWSLDDQTRALLSTCSSLVTIVNDNWSGRQVVHFSHFSVKEFLMSNRFTSALEDSSRHQIVPGPAVHVHDTASFSITRTAPQLITGASANTPAVSLGGIDTPVPSARAQSPFATLTPSRFPTFPERVGGQKPDGDGAITPSSTRWNYSKRKRTTPIEQTEGYTHTRSRAIEAIGGALGMAASIGHEVLFTGVDLLQFAPVPGLDLAGKILLSIWDAVQMVETNRLASLRLIERCADILISIRGEIADAGNTIAEELRAPMEKLVKAFEGVYNCLSKLGQRPFLKRYLRRGETLSSISTCDTALNDAREMFSLSIQIRTLKLVVKAIELRQEETHDRPESLSHVSPSPPPAHLPLPSVALQSLFEEPESVRNTLHALRAAQDEQDCVNDMADLHQLMRSALEANDDVAMFDVLQIARSEMPEAIKTLERALKRVVEEQQPDAEDSTMALPTSQEEAGKGISPSLYPRNTSTSHTGADRLDHEFIVTGIGALRRLSKGTDLRLPSWTITWLEVDLEAKVGLGAFSDVYRGKWCGRTVAVKVLAETTPRKIFLREVEIWKSLYHPNVLELFGASSASGEPPWFLVCKYYPQGNLVKYLKGLSNADAAKFNEVKMIYEIAKGMAYLHNKDVLHGDLKAANILVDDDTSCVISDFGQSEMKSEVYRITRVSQSPGGTLRWRAPELMEGAQTLTAQMDVYAFAICCWEILNMGALPWPYMDDSAVRHFVLNENMRPQFPPSKFVSGHLMTVICASWDHAPSKRPSFEKIVRELNEQRVEQRAQIGDAAPPSGASGDQGLGSSLSTSPSATAAHTADATMGMSSAAHTETRVQSGIQQNANGIDEIKWDQLNQVLRAWLSPTDPQTKYDIARKFQHKGAAVWSIHANTIIEWKSTGSILWIHGKPGSGKSVICSFIIQDILAACETGSATMAYFYFDFRDLNKKRCHDLLLSLVFQLSTQSSPCCDILHQVYKTHKDGTRQPSDDTLKECLKEMLRLPAQGPIFIVLDALDECSDPSGISSPRNKVLQLVKDLVELGLQELHICVTSRLQRDIYAVLGPLGFRSVSLDNGNVINTEIVNYVRSFVKYNSRIAIMRWRADDKNLVMETLIGRANGMFRWVSCQLEALEHCLPPNLRQVLENLPKTLDETYEQILKGINKTRKDTAHRLLQCITIASRPLRVEELAELLAFDFPASSWVGIPTLKENWRWDDQEEAVLSTCSSLIVIVPKGDSRVVQFSDSSVKEYLTSPRLARSPHGDVSRFHIDLKSAHTIMAQVCLATLLRPDEHARNSDAKGSPLAEYAARHWVEHTQFDKVSLRVRDGMDDLFDSSKPHFAAWLRVHDVDKPWFFFTPRSKVRSGSPLYYAAFCGFYDLAERLIMKHPEQVNARGGLNLSPLLAALYKRQFRVANLLYMHGATVDVQDSHDNTPLHEASKYGKVDMMCWLLEHGAHANHRNSVRRTPLHDAAYCTELDAVQVLLEHHADVNSQDGTGTTPLYEVLTRASGPEGKVVDIVRRLLEYGADLNISGHGHSPALHQASSRGWLELSRLLLSYGAMVDAKDKTGRTPFQVAASLAVSGEHDEIMKLLLEHGAVP